MAGVRGALSDFGDIMKVPTSGASKQTAGYDRLGYYGVPASHTMAQTDLEQMQVYYPKIRRVANRSGINPHLIAAIISRESRAGKDLKDWGKGFGWGDYGKAFGLMQVDTTDEGGRNQAIGEWDSEEHLEHATGRLVDFIRQIQSAPWSRHWSREEQLKGGIAAYNMGPGNVERAVKEGRDVDYYTTGQDYANDVVARAQWYQKQSATTSRNPGPAPTRNPDTATTPDDFATRSTAVGMAVGATAGVGVGTTAVVCTSATAVALDAAIVGGCTGGFIGCAVGAVGGLIVGLLMK